MSNNIGLPTRRAALGALAGGGALAAGITAAVPASVSDLDTPLSHLLDRWRAANSAHDAANERVRGAEALIGKVKFAVPLALIKTEGDNLLFQSDEQVGAAYLSSMSIERMEKTVRILVRVMHGSDRVLPMVDRIVAIKEAHRDHFALVDAAKRSVGFDDLLAEQVAALEAEKVLRRRVGQARARTLPGLLAKLAAIAEAWGSEDLEAETAFEDEDSISLEFIALSALRDAVAIVNVTGAGNV